MIKLFDETFRPIEVKFWSFPGGERGVRIEDLVSIPAYMVIDFQGSDDLIDMLMLNDAVKRQSSGIDLHAIIRYMPYARQDRVCMPGEAHALSVASSLINSCNFKSVEIWDPHSDVTGALIDRIIIKNQNTLFWKTVGASSQHVLLSPDAGALKKIYSCSVGNEVVCAQKARDPETGKLSGCYIVPQDIEKLIGREVWIVDDICDGGGTFIQLIRYIKSQVPENVLLNINLYVTHGIFSKGKQCLYDAGFNQVISANDRSD